MPASPSRAVLRRFELLFPGLALLNLEGVGVRSSEGAEDLVRLGREKAFD